MALEQSPRQMKVQEIRSRFKEGKASTKELCWSYENERVPFNAEEAEKRAIKQAKLARRAANSMPDSYYSTGLEP